MKSFRHTGYESAQSLSKSLTIKCGFNTIMRQFLPIVQLGLVILIEGGFGAFFSHLPLVALAVLLVDPFDRLAFLASKSQQWRA